MQSQDLFQIITDSGEESSLQHQYNSKECQYSQNVMSFLPRILNFLTFDREPMSNNSDSDFSCRLPNEFEMDASLLNNLIIYSWLSVTSLFTAVIATKSYLRYQKYFIGYLKQVRLHVEDWFLVFFTIFWLLSVGFPYGCCVVWRWTVGIYMKLRYGQLGDIATGLDSAGSMDVPTSLQIIKSLKVLEGKCDIALLRQRVEKTACRTNAKSGKLIYPKFHQFLDCCGGYYCWKPAKFDMNHHVRFVEGMDMNSESISESQALEVVSKMSNVAFDKHRGYWEILVIPKFHYDKDEGVKDRVEKFAILIRISHGIGDGFSFLKLVMRDMAGEDAEEYVPPSKRSSYTAKVSSLLYRICVFLYVIFKTPRAFYNEMRLKDTNPLHNSEIQISGEKIHLWSEPINIEWLKKLKNELGSGMSSILLESLSGACRSYIVKQIGTPETDLPKTISAMIPVPAPNHPDNQLVNKFSIIMMPLEIRTGNVLNRCRLIEKEAKIKASSPDSYMNLFLMDLVAVFPVSMARFFIVNTQCSTVISNLPGPSKTVSIWGWKLIDTMFWLPNVGSSGISVSYLSYENKLRIGLAIDTAVIPDGKVGARKLLDWMVEDLRQLSTAARVSVKDMILSPESEVVNSSSRKIKNLTLDPIKIDEEGTSSEDCGYEEDDEEQDELIISKDKTEVRYLKQEDADNASNNDSNNNTTNKIMLTKSGSKVEGHR